MVRIGICGGSRSERNKIREISDKYLKEQGIIADFIEFSVVKEFNTYYKADGKALIDLLFWDIGVGKPDSVALERHVQSVVVIINHECKMPMIFNSKVLAFLEKPIENEEIICFFDKMLWDLVYRVPVIYAGISGWNKIIPENIRYIKAEKDYTYLYIVGSIEPIWTRHRLKWWEEKLVDSGFIKVHKSYIVNLKHILSIKSYVEVRGEVNPIPLGRTYRDLVRGAYHEYLVGKKDEINEQVYK